MKWNTLSTQEVTLDDVVQCTILVGLRHPLKITLILRTFWRGLSLTHLQCDYDVLYVCSHNVPQLACFF